MSDNRNHLRLAARQLKSSADEVYQMVTQIPSQQPFPELDIYRMMSLCSRIWSRSSACNIPASGFLREVK